MRLILLILALTLPLAAKNERNNKFYVFDDCASLSSAACDLTVQQPAAGSKWVTFEAAQVYCSVDCAVTVSRDGTAASTTAATENSLNGGVTAAATAFIDSNAGAGTTIVTVKVAAGQVITLDLDGLFLENNNTTTNNLTIQTDAITGDASIYIRWREE